MGVRRGKQPGKVMSMVQSAGRATHEAGCPAPVRGGGGQPAKHIGTELR